MSYKPIGPAKLYMGDPTSGLNELADVMDVGVDLGQRTAFTSTHSLSGVPHENGIYALADQAEVQADIEDADIATLKELLLGGTTTSGGTDDTIGGNDSFTQISSADLPTLFVLPETEEADGVSAAHGFWLPGVTITGPNGLTYGRVDEGEIQVPYNVSFQAVYRENDQGDTSIPSGNRIWFMGPPANLSLSWSLE